MTTKPTPKPPVDNRPDDPNDNPPVDNPPAEPSPENPAPEGPAESHAPEEQETQIVHRERIIQGDQIVDKVHGPMPVSEWAAYEKKNNL